MGCGRWRGVVFALGWLAGAAVCAEAQQAGGCASTPAAAIAAARLGSSLEGSGPGYRVEAVRRDAMQGRTWAVIRSCDHAEWPTIALLADLPVAVARPAQTAGSSVAVGSAGSASSVTARVNVAPVVVHAGDAVRLSKMDGAAHIELMAVAEENGIEGARVRVRLAMQKDADGQSAPGRQLAGVVRGPADVEME